MRVYQGERPRGCVGIDGRRRVPTDQGKRTARAGPRDAGKHLALPNLPTLAASHGPSDRLPHAPACVLPPCPVATVARVAHPGQAQWLLRGRGCMHMKDIPLGIIRQLTLFLRAEPGTPSRSQLRDGPDEL